MAGGDIFGVQKIVPQMGPHRNKKASQSPQSNITGVIKSKMKVRTQSTRF